MPKLEISDLESRPEFGRVRARMIGDLDVLRRSLDSEIDFYSECFTDEEIKELKALSKSIKKLHKLIDRNEDRRLGL